MTTNCGELRCRSPYVSPYQLFSRQCPGPPELTLQFYLLWFINLTNQYNKQYAKIQIKPKQFHKKNWVAIDNNPIICVNITVTSRYPSVSLSNAPRHLYEPCSDDTDTGHKLNILTQDDVPIMLIESISIEFICLCVFCICFAILIFKSNIYCYINKP